MSCLCRLERLFILTNYWTRDHNSAVLRSKLVNNSKHNAPKTAASIRHKFYSTVGVHSTRTDEQKIVDQKNKSLIIENTVKHQSLMVPELSLYLITPTTPLWKAPYDDAKMFENDPFWSIFWPGGQALCRYILDGGNKFLAGKRVLDLGCGSGAAVLAALAVGAKKPVYANDVDQVALASVLLNADVNGIKQEDIVLSSKNYLEGSTEKNAFDLSIDFDVIFVGDMFYDDVIGRQVTSLIHYFVESSNPGTKIVLVGDPGRWYLSQHRNNDLKCLANYHLPRDVREENFGFTQTSVYLYRP